MEQTKLDLSTTLATAETIARQAGEILRRYYDSPRQFEHKQRSIDLVTQADRDSEKLVVNALREAFPDHHVHGEEGGGYGPAPEDTPFHWHVDPLDGTTNFAHRLPIFSVSIALSDPDLHPQIGVVYNPMVDQCFTAIRGEGAWLNGERMQVSAVDTLAQALTVTGFSYDNWTNPDNNIDHFAHFLSRTQGVRRLGSAALDLCYVAAGQLDVYWERNTNPWDVQAGLLCVLEAGGRISDHEGQINRTAYSGKRILATNGLLHDQAVTVLTLGDAAPRFGA